MRRYLQFTITEPLEPAATPDDRVQIESAIIGIDLHTGHVTLPGGFVCSLENLARIVGAASVGRENWSRFTGGPWWKT